MTITPDVFTNIQNSVNQFIVTPLNAFGIGGFVFDVDAETTANLSAEITDHYTEDNKSIQDHIAIKPKKVTLKRFISEVRYTPNQGSTLAPQNMIQKLTTLTSFLPALSQAESQLTELANSVSGGNLESAFTDITNAGSSLWALSKNILPTQGRQQQAYLFFKALYEQKILMSVQTPFEFMSSMAIESIVATQPEESNTISHFTMVLKEVRFASTLVATVQGSAQKAVSQGRSALQAASAVVSGNVSGNDPSETINSFAGKVFSSADSVSKNILAVPPNINPASYPMISGTASLPFLPEFKLGHIFP